MKIAISGTIGSGKSSVGKYLRSLGYVVFDADEINADLLKKGNSGYLKIKENFRDVFLSNGEIDRMALAALIFNDEKKRVLLNSILHPLILKELNAKMQENQFFIAEIPLLFEVGWEDMFDDTLLIVAEKKEIIERLKNRGLSEKQAIERIASQMSVELKLKKAKHVIYNDSTLTELYKRVDEWIKEIGI